MPNIIIVLMEEQVIYFKTGIVKNIKDYKGSSYNDYLSNKSTITDKDILEGYFINTESFTEFNNQKSYDKCLDYVK